MMYYWFLIGVKNPDAKFSFLLYYFKITYPFGNISFAFSQSLTSFNLELYLENKSPKTKLWKLPHHNQQKYIVKDINTYFQTYQYIFSVYFQYIQTIFVTEEPY